MISTFKKKLREKTFIKIFYLAIILNSSNVYTMQKRIQFINHSCVLISTNRIKILCDPWFIGNAFDNGWSLLYEKSHDINLIDFNYIFISHEHPDHFSIPTLKKLNGPKTFLYQKTKDRKVITYLEKNGHNVVELENGKPHKIADLILTIYTIDGFDSVLKTEFSDGKTFLNINDARVDLNNADKLIKDSTYNEVDLVAFQFSYANWAGNKGDKEIPKHQQQIVDEKNIYILETYKPKNVLLFASFVYFCHEENYFWNDYDWLEHAYKTLHDKKVNVIIPKPNQYISLDKVDKTKLSNDNQDAMQFWDKKRKNAGIKVYSEKKYNLSQLKKYYAQFNENIWSNNDMDYTFIKDIDIICKIKDINKLIKFSLINKKFTNVDKSKDSGKFDFAVSSETLAFLFNNNFSRGTITINGKIEFNYNTSFLFFVFFFIPYANNIGIYFNDKNVLTKKKLRSIENTAVMKSILNLHPKVKSDYNKILERTIF